MNRPPDNHGFRRAIATVLRIGLLSAFVLATLHLQVSVQNERDYQPYIFSSTYELPGPSVLAAAGLNYRTAVADLVWVDAVQTVAEGALKRRTVDDVTYYARTITDLDPFFHKVYTWHSAARMLTAGYPSPEDIEASNDILEKGMKYFPSDWRLPYEAAVNYIGFSRGIDDSTRKKQLRRAVWFATAASEDPGSPDTVVLLATRFQDRLRALETGSAGDTEPTNPRLLARLYLLAESEPVRRSLRRRMENHPEAASILREVRKYHETFGREFQSSRWRYLGPKLFILVSDDTHSSASTFHNTPGSK